MQKLVYLNKFVEIADSPILSERIQQLDLNALIIKHPDLGIMAAPRSEVQVVTRKKDYFNDFQDYERIATIERAIASARQRDRQLTPTPSNIRGLSPRYGGVRHEESTFFRMSRSNRANNLWTALVPLDADRHVGIELEVCSHSGENFFMNTLKSHALSRYVSLTSDGSIEPDNAELDCDCDFHDEYGHEDGCAVNESDFSIEMRILCKETELSKVCALITDFTKLTHCYVNTTCGVHVHLDMRTRDVWDSYENLFAKLDDMYGKVQKHRIGNGYCQRNTRNTFDDHDSIDNRYYAINTKSYDEHSTLEIRLYHGTIDGAEIKNWIDFLIQTVDNTNTQQTAVAV